MHSVTTRKETSKILTGPAAARFLTWTVIVGCGVGVSLYLAWQLLSSVNFAYGLIYDWAEIDAAIAEYGPQNRYKRGLETTPRAERERIFGAIVTAINDGGKGLEQIRYYDKDGRDLGLFLRPAEVVHLQDVAMLLGTLRGWSYLAAAVLVAGVLAARWRGWMRPSVKRTLLGVVVVCAMVGAAVLAYGPTKLFYQWHTLVFPENHQWFFYYQESLMTTLMRAPVIFGYIAVLLAVCALAVFAVLWWGLGWFLPGRGEAARA